MLFNYVYPLLAQVTTNNTGLLELCADAKLDNLSLSTLKRKTQWCIIFKNFDKSVNKLCFFHTMRDASKFVSRK